MIDPRKNPLAKAVIERYELRFDAEPPVGNGDIDLPWRVRIVVNPILDGDGWIVKAYSVLADYNRRMMLGKDVSDLMDSCPLVVLIAGIWMKELENQVGKFWESQGWKRNGPWKESAETLDA